MTGGNENRLNAGNELIDIIRTESFPTLDLETKHQVIEAHSNEKARSGGIMGRFFGTRPESTAIYIGFILTIVLVLFLLGVVCFVKTPDGNINMDLVNRLVPLITLSIGYTFGKSVG